MNIRSKVLKNRNIPDNGELLGSIYSKPYGIMIVGIIIGVFLIFNKYYLIGSLILLLFTYYLCFVKNCKLIEFYDQYAVFNLHNRKDESYVLFWEDVASWNIQSKWNDCDVLTVVLKNQEVIKLNCIGRKKIKKYFLTCTNIEQEPAKKINVKQCVK